MVLLRGYSDHLLSFVRLNRKASSTEDIARQTVDIGGITEIERGQAWLVVVRLLRFRASLPRKRGRGAVPMISLCWGQSGRVLVDANWLGNVVWILSNMNDEVKFDPVKCHEPL